MENEEIELELKMYFFVTYYLSDKQIGIQAGHVALEYADKYGGEEQFIKFNREWKTFIVLDGGTTNNGHDFKGVPLGTMNQILEDLQTNDIQYSIFQEPSLNDALTAICFICDERVFNEKDYPEFVDYLFSISLVYVESKWKSIKEFSYEELVKKFPTEYKEWVRFLGGVKNVFLRELIKDKKLA